MAACPIPSLASYFDGHFAITPLGSVWKLPLEMSREDTGLYRNRLLWTDPTVDGMKTGLTQSAGHCLIASAKRGERRGARTTSQRERNGYARLIAVAVFVALIFFWVMLFIPWGYELLILAALARGRDVLISRGELVEIGGGFRIAMAALDGGARDANPGIAAKAQKPVP
mgnify:CR=1 FL=1